MTISKNVDLIDGRYVLPPFDLLDEWVSRQGMSWKKFPYFRSGISKKNVNLIGERRPVIDEKIAEKLEGLTGISKDTWIDQQDLYQKQVERLNEPRNLDERTALITSDDERLRLIYYYAAMDDSRKILESSFGTIGNPHTRYSTKR